LPQFVSQLADVDADIQSYFKTNDLRVDSRCYIVDDQSMIAMVACGRGFAIMPELMFKTGTDPAGIGKEADFRRAVFDPGADIRIAALIDLHINTVPIIKGASGSS